MCNNHVYNPRLKFKPGVETYFYTDNVFLFIPNIVDYIRIFFLVLFIVLSHHDVYQLASICYVISVALDELDGNLARHLNQTSLFGMLLDILIDEVTVFYMCSLLGSIYPQYRMYFQFITIIDITGQWMNYQYAAMYRRNDYTRKDNWILNIYFNKKIFTNFWVYGNHIFLLMLYVCSFNSGVPSLWRCCRPCGRIGKYWL
ncbi:hypothetical protein ACF0H5_021791 [Mactra antiquata]